MSAPALRGAHWATVRLHRTALWWGAALVAAAAAVTLFLRWAASAYPEPKSWNCVGACKPTFLGFPSGESLLDTFAGRAAGALLFLPLLVGVVVAGPMIARELESGIHRLAWTQSLSPARWLAAKLTVAATATTAGTVALMGLLQLADRGTLYWPQRGVYEATGPALLAYSLLAVGLGTLFGLLIRRAFAAMAMTGLVTGLVLFAIGAVRWDLFPVRTITGQGLGIGHEPRLAFRMESGYTTASGTRLPYDACWQRTRSFGDCPADLHVTGWYLDYHPHSHFWYVQLIESGIVLALTAAAMYAAFRVLRRRTA